jgi:hypothetical protein
MHERKFVSLRPALETEEMKGIEKKNNKQKKTDEDE